MHAGPATTYRLLLQDPVVQQQKESKLARIAIRRINRDRLKRSPGEQAERLARSNAVILKQAAKSLMHTGGGGVRRGNLPQAAMHMSGQEV